MEKYDIGWKKAKNEREKRYKQALKPTKASERIKKAFDKWPSPIEIRDVTIFVTMIAVFTGFASL